VPDIIIVIVIINIYSIEWHYHEKLQVHYHTRKIIYFFVGYAYSHFTNTLNYLFGSPHLVWLYGSQMSKSNITR